MSKNIYNVPTEGCNLEIMGYDIYAEKVSPNEAYRRREYNVNNIVGGTQIVTPGAYVGLDFTVTTHIPVNPDRPNVHDKIFQEMMSKPVKVISPEIAEDPFMAIVVVKPEHVTPDSLEVNFTIKEVPDKKSLIPGEEFIIPTSRKISKKKSNKKNKTTSKKNSKKSKTKKKKTSKKSKSKKNK